MRRRHRRRGSGRRTSPTWCSTSAPRWHTRAAIGALLKEVIELFRSDCPRSLRRIDLALKQRDGEALRLAAHGLKGAIATIGAPAGRQAAAAIEQAARAADFDEAQKVRDRLHREIERLDAALVAAGLLAPAKRRPAARRRPSSRKAQAIMSRILVVDDDKTTRHVLSSVLTNAGYTTSVAKDGVEALKALAGGASICCCSTSGCRA